MQLVADRFITTAPVKQGHAFDLATNQSIWLRVGPRGGEDAYRRWIVKCDGWFREQSTPGNSLIDYGPLGVSERFEVWLNAAEAVCRACPAAIAAEEGLRAAVADRPAIAALAELFQSTDARRGQIVSLRVPTPSTLGSAVCVLARQARLKGFVPVAAQAMDGHARFLEGRTLCLIDDGFVLMPGVRAVLACPRAHVCVCIGIAERRGMHSVSVGPIDGGRYGRIEERRVHPRSRIAEQPAAYTPDSPPAGSFPPPTSASSSEIAVPSAASGEMEALRRRVEQSNALLASGRHAPGLRLLRQTLGALARRQAWTDATLSSLTLAVETMKRGRSRDALHILNDAARHAGRANDAGSLLDVALLTGHAWIDAAHLDEAERVLAASLTSARSSGDRQRQVLLSCALARCLFWRAEYAAASAYLELPAETSLTDPVAIRRLRMAARLAVARGDGARALDALAECRRRVPTDAPGLLADIEDTTAFVKLVMGDHDAVHQHAALSAAAAHQARRPLRELSARLLQAEADRRRSRRLTESTGRTLGRLSATATPLLRARWDLLAALGTSPDVLSVTARQISVSGLKALELFSGTGRANVCQGIDPIAGDVVAILQVCQQAEDEGALVREVCVRVRQRLRAAAVALIVPADRGYITVAADGSRIEPEIVRRVFGLGMTIAPARVRERIESAALVEYGGKAVGALCARWTIGTTEDLSRAAAVLSMAAVAASPLVAAFLARQAAPAAATQSTELLGVTPRIADLRREIDRAAAAPFAVLIQGESGSGKELVARAVHRVSPRRDRGFSTLNCAALPDDLVEAELFGHSRGAFTGAVGERPGVFEEANGGTLFLDEVGELSARAQAKLLRVIQEGELRRIGENISRRVDVRIVAATNRDLRADVEAGRFRLDLWYRLDVVRIVVPPLRGRPEDIALLIDHFWNEATRRLGSRATLSVPTRAALTQYAWPGNVRELQNVLAALAVRSPKRGIVPPSALPTHFADTNNPETWRLQIARRTFEEQFIRAALIRTGGHRGRAADELGVSRQGLAKLMARLGIT
ncbi:MAG TPA: sigma 54-interacting transcriptional regulator [Vicinamibacterales bacterium]